MSKLDLHGGGMKTKLILHIEKIVFGLAVLLVALFIYWGTLLEPIDIAPQDVSRAATQAKSNIEQSKWEVVEDDRWSEPEYQEAAQRGNEDIPLAPYETPNSFRVRHRESVEKRSDPEMLTLTDLEVRPGHAPMAILAVRRGTSNGYDEGYGNEGSSYPPGYGSESEYDDYGDGGYGSAASSKPTLTAEQRAKFGPQRANVNVKGTYFVAVTGLIPLKKQLDLYDAAFKDRADYREARDYPNYVWYSIERREKTPGGTWSEWGSPINVRAATQLADQTWDNVTTPLAPPEYVDPILTQRMAPILFYDATKWGLHSAVPKFVPKTLGSEGEYYAEEEQVQPLPAVIDPTQPGADLPIDMPGQVGPDGRPVRGYPGRSGNSYDSGYGSNSRIPKTAPPGTILKRNSAGRSGGYGGDYSEGYGSSQSTSMYDAERKMFRFFDTTVKENMVYQYRVQLWVEDPNNPMSLQNAPTDRALEPSVIKRVASKRPKETTDPNAKPQYREYWRKTEFSEPSPEAYVRPDGDVLVGGVESGRIDYAQGTRRVIRAGDPSAQVLAMKWDPVEKVVATAQLEEVNRGSKAMFHDKLWVMDPATQEFRKLGGDDDETYKNGYSVDSEHVVLDMRGGGFLPGRLRDEDNNKLRAPGEILVMDSSGNLKIKSEAKEADEFALYNFPNPDEKKIRKKEEDPYGEYGEGYEGYDEYGGGSRRRRR